MWPPLSEVKSHCVIDEDSSHDDILLTGFISAAKNHIAQTLNRKIVSRTSDIELDEDTLLPIDEYVLAMDTEAGSSIRLALLLVVGHWYLNRESTSTLTIKEVPMSFNALLQPYRVY